jgi:glycerophosphoryl diester phosphodiesterase
MIITAHRGSSVTAPENTLASVRQAIAEGADIVEIDVRETRDGVLVVVHDPDLRRVAGCPHVVGLSSYAELAEIDVGRLNDPAFAGERIPTLAEVAAEVKGKVRLNVEIKGSKPGGRLAMRVLDVLDDAGLGAEDALLMSLIPEEIREARAYGTGVPLGLIVSAAIGELWRLDLDFVALSAALAEPELVAMIRDAGKPVHIWTVNETEAMQRIIELGVEGIITDRPARLRALVESGGDTPEMREPAQAAQR